MLDNIEPKITGGVAAKLKKAVFSQKELIELYYTDVKDFSANAAESLGHILQKRGIADPQKWFEQKMRSSIPVAGFPYIYAPSIESETVGIHGVQNDSIKFASSNLTKFTRAHEMVHRVTSDASFIKHFFPSEIMHTGFLKVSKTEPLGRTRGVDNKFHETGRGLNEGATQLMAEKFAKEPADNVYFEETFLARQIKDLIGSDLFFEGMLFDPKVLEGEVDKRAGTLTFSGISSALDAFQLLEVVERETYSELRKTQGGEEQKGALKEKISNLFLYAEHLYKSAQRGVLKMLTTPIEQASNLEELKTAKSAFKDFCKKLMEAPDCPKATLDVIKETTLKMNRVAAEKINLNFRRSKGDDSINNP